MARPQRMQTDATTILSVTGWTGSKASGDADGGASALEGWLNHKAKRTILATQRQGDVFQIQIAEKDKRSFTHLNGYRWAGVDLVITEGQLTAPPAGPRGGSQPFSQNRSQNFNQPQQQNGSLSSRISGNQNNNFNNNQNRNQPKELFNAPSGPRKGGPFQQNRQPNGQPSSNPFGSQSQQHTQQTPENARLEETLANVTRKRYNAAEKFLDFSALATDPDIQALGLVSSSAEKVFKALFVVVEKYVFETRDKRADMVESVSFKNNGLTSVREIIGASSTFFKVRNLDLSENNFQKISDLTWWKNRFPDLEQIILTGNPVDGPQTRDEVRKWYKKLKTYDMQPLDVLVPGALQPNLETIPPVPTSSPALGGGPNGQILTSAAHPEFPDGDPFGLPVPGKADEQVVKEQQCLKFSYETGLKMQWVVQCLEANAWDYDKAMNDLNNAMSQGNIPADAFIQ